jgi:hypothetical protein
MRYFRQKVFVLVIYLGDFFLLIRAIPAPRDKIKNWPTGF